MTGAGRLFSDPQPVTAKAAPLCLPVSSVGNANAQNVRPRRATKAFEQDPRRRLTISAAPEFPSGMEAEG
ncbi:hypothetical protein M2192_004301 [Bradyrhizobium elkanii USDA 61]|jgi:hypothetical protein|nr:hypothetical protein [Bradyrhizobium elkanii]MCS4007341.1 hypothetical protein [Bradyrhizobium elkanii USDA 61]MCP1929334.1 hypothetical protein [Bradyrhizobium elkanii]MCS3473347.1 hypothetical protein [Bradyrhizobium elkanii]MCS3580054.1 hypothetical protein [Bradyrhizobium elkanii]